MALIQGKQIAANTITGGATGNLALTTVTSVNVNNTILAFTGAFFDATGPVGPTSLISNVTNPVSPQDAATKSYVDAAAGTTLSWKNPVSAGTNNTQLSDPYTSTPTVLTRTGNGAFPPANIDGQTPTVGMRVLIKDQTGGLAKDNGIYVFTAVGSGAAPWVLTRSGDADTAAELIGAAVAVSEPALPGPGTLDDTIWLQTSPTTVLGTDPVTFTRLGQTFTAGLGISAAQLAVGIIQAQLIPAPNANARGLTFVGNDIAAALEAPGVDLGGLEFAAGTGLLRVDTATFAAGTGAGAIGGMKLTATGLSTQFANVVTVPTNGPGAHGGLQMIAGPTGGLSVFLEAASATAGGLELLGGSQGSMQVLIAPNLVGSPVNASRGGLQYTATGVSTRIAFQTGGPAGPLQGGGLQIFNGIAPAQGLSVLLEAGGAGTGGLTLAGPGATPPGTTNNPIRIQVAPGVAGTGTTAVGGNKLTATGLSVAFAPVVLGGVGASGGLKTNGAGEISVALDPPGANSGGLEIVGTGEIRIDQATPAAGTGIAAVGGTKLVASGLSVAFAPVVLGNLATASGGLRTNNAGEISVDLEPAGANTGGLSIAGTGQIRVNASPTGGLQLTGTGLAVVAGNGITVGANVAVNFGAAPPNVAKNNAVGVANTVSRSDHTHASPQPVTVDQNKFATANAAAPGNPIPFNTNPLSFDPAFGPAAGQGSFVAVKMNGIQYPIGNGTTGAGGPGGEAAFYFSKNGGVTPSLLKDINSTDLLYLGDWTGTGQTLFTINGTTNPPQLTRDIFDFDYLAFYP